MKQTLFATSLLFLSASACAGRSESTSSSSAAVCVVSSLPAPCQPGQTCIGAANDQRRFPETGITVRGAFLDFVDKAGVSATGLPISNVWKSVSGDGKSHWTQCFERQVLEYHEDLAANCNAVVLGRPLAKNRYLAKYGPDGASGQSARRLTNPGDQPSCFPESAHCIEPIMYDWWQATGGVAVNGFPISDYFEEESPEEPGRKYWVQYFERTVGEYHQTDDGRWYVAGQLLGKYAPECPNVAGAKLALVSSRSAELTKDRGFYASWWTTSDVGGKKTIAAYGLDGALVVRITKASEGGVDGIAVYPRSRPHDGAPWSASDVTAILAAYSNDNEDVDVWECLGTVAHFLLSGLSTIVDCAAMLDPETGFDATFCTNELETTPNDVADVRDACISGHDATTYGTKQSCLLLDNGVFDRVVASCDSDLKCICTTP